MKLDESHKVRYQLKLTKQQLAGAGAIILAHQK
jgi:hypothetical protein